MIIIYNQNTTILNKSFFKNNYNQIIEKLELSHSNIDIINDSTFTLMLNLKYLYLNNNKLKFITNNCFKHLNNKLELLDLSNNPITKIDHKSFSHLSSLEYFYLHWLVEANEKPIFIRFIEFSLLKRF